MQLQNKYGDMSSSSAESSSSLTSTSSNRREEETTQYLTALADFEAEHEDELSFLKGDTLIFVRQHDSDWSVARCLRTGGEGMYPSGYAKWKFPKVQIDIIHYIYICLKNKNILILQFCQK